MKKKKIFVLGGMKSGKSGFALAYGESHGKELLFLATAIETDTEMAERIRAHRKDRDSRWKTIEENENIAGVFASPDINCDILLLDSLGFWVSQMVMEKRDNTWIMSRVNSLLDSVNRASFSTIIVSDEVGMGIIPDNPIARRFIDIAGKVNQMIAKDSDEVFFVVSGIPLKLK